VFGGTGFLGQPVVQHPNRRKRKAPLGAGPSWAGRISPKGGDLGDARGAGRDNGRVVVGKLGQLGPPCREHNSLIKGRTAAGRACQPIAFCRGVSRVGRFASLVP
jgi:hypothetical protein